MDEFNNNTLGLQWFACFVYTCSLNHRTTRCNNRVGLNNHVGQSLNSYTDGFTGTTKADLQMTDDCVGLQLINMRSIVDTSQACIKQVKSAIYSRKAWAGSSSSRYRYKLPESVVSET